MRRLSIVLLLVVVILAVGILIFLWPPPDEHTEIEVGPVAEIEAGEVVFVEQHGLYLVIGEDGPLALDDDSRHVGDRVLFCKTSGTFSSPAHGEFFDLQGRYMGGPASGDLGRYQVSIRDGHLFVNLAELELPDRSSSPYQPNGPRCQGPEGPAGFYSDGAS